ncbi:MAG: TetR/AcrR family transcriptional regulator [Mycolicibacterium neoaurum]|uniref:TetR/AcrR family transcriptional regulator n=1 Tax=Mycolicibacterium neoaurum TaxID=1795 RepID=UPI002FF6CCB6
MPAAEASTGGPSKRELQRAASVRRIVTAAEDLLSESDRFSEISVEQVIARAQVSRSTFYSYFDDLGHLLRVVGQGVVGEVVQSARRWMDLDGAVTEAALVEIFTDLVKTYRRRAKLLAALAEASVYDPGVREEFHGLLTVGHVELAKHIRRAQDAGGARADIDPESTAAWLVWMVERGLYQQIRPAGPTQTRRHVAALAAIIWHSLYAPDPDASSESR